MQRGTNTKSEIIALLEGRPEKFLQKIRQFILDLDERDYIDFLYPPVLYLPRNSRSVLLKHGKCLKT